MAGRTGRRGSIGAALAAALLAGLLGVVGPARAATTYQVDQGAGCSPTGAGGAPFCTIAKAAAVAQAGDTVVVAAGTYREGVELPASGAPGAPITFKTTAAARILGTADLSAAAWALVGGTTETYSVAYPVAPRKVTVDGAPLRAAASATLARGEFFYDATPGSPTANTLFVRTADGSAPTAHHIEAGRFGYAFRGVGRSHLVVDGFTMEDQNNDAVLFSGGSHLAVRSVTVKGAGLQGLFLDAVSASSITGSEVSGSGSQGVLLRGGSQLSVDRVRSHHNGFHGIAIQGSTASTIQRCTAWANERPAIRSAAGISVDGDLRPSVGSTASGNVVRQNIAHSNQDTGIALHTGSTASLVAANLTYGNGDHGFDTLRSTNNRLLGNTAASNAKDGFSVEGSATGTELAGNIGVDNGLTVTPKEFDLFVDPSSTAGFKSDSNLFWNSVAGVAPIKYNGTTYATLAGYQAASGKDAHSRSADPRFANPGGGDYQLGAGSPAVDSGTSAPAGYPTVDLAGNPRRDNALTANTGQGPVNFYDMGAYERQADAVTKAAPRLTMTMPRNPITAGQVLVVNAALANASTGAPVGGAVVELWGHSYL
jgi:parallel beta-helix repeat protein